jgi:hypothetical protein
MQTTTTIPGVIFAGKVKPTASLVQPVRNTGWIKPEGGIWTTPEGSDGWLNWCKREDFSEPEAMTEYKLEPKVPAKLAVIDSLGDLEDIVADYGRVAYRMTVLDFERMARRVDGIWLTERGQWATRMTTPNLYGWDLESILFFRWIF